MVVKSVRTGRVPRASDLKVKTIIARAMLNADDRAKEMGMRGGRLVKESFTLEKVVDKLEKLYENVLRRVE